MSEVIFPQFVGPEFENKSFEASHEEYHAIKDAVHSSSLSNMLKSPHAYRYFLKHPKEQTKSMKFGTLAHGVILEGQKFLDKYKITPIFRGVTKDGKETTSMAATSVKEQHKEWLASLPPDTIIITQEEHDKLMFMLDSMLSHKFIQEVFKDGVCEYKKQWRDPLTGLKCVSSDDFVSFKHGLWADIKTTPSSDWSDFRRSVEGYNYPLQAAFYDQGIRAVHGKELPDKVWVSIESVPPYEAKIHYVSPYYMEVGNLMVKRAILDLKRCIKNNHWPQGQVIVEAGEPSFNFKSIYDQALLEENV